MRSDYLSYVVAVICFLLAGIVFATTFAVNPAYLEDTIGTVLTAVLAFLGIILVGIGYSQRPKKVTSTPPEPTSAPATQVQQARQVEAETQEFVPAKPVPKPEPEPMPAPTSTTTATPYTVTPSEEPEKKAVRRRRKKA